MANEFKSIKEKQEDLLVEEANHMTPQERAGMRVLISRFDNPSPFRPMDVFDMNFGSAASVAGLILTYVIVLMQFKMSDPVPSEPA